MATEADNIMAGFRAGNLAAEVDRQEREAYKTGIAATFDDITGGILGATSALNASGIIQEATDTRSYREKVEGYKGEMAGILNQESLIAEIEEMYMNAFKGPEFMQNYDPDVLRIMQMIEDA